MNIPSTSAGTETSKKPPVFRFRPAQPSHDPDYTYPLITVLRVTPFDKHIDGSIQIARLTEEQNLCLRIGTSLATTIPNPNAFLAPYKKEHVRIHYSDDLGYQLQRYVSIIVLCSSAPPFHDLLFIVPWSIKHLYPIYLSILIVFSPSPPSLPPLAVCMIPQQQSQATSSLLNPASPLKMRSSPLQHHLHVN